jgi:hypothetical protein
MTAAGVLAAAPAPARASDVSVGSPPGSTPRNDQNEPAVATDLSAAPSIDIANGAPGSAGATDEIVDVWADGGDALNANTARLACSTDGGSTWWGPVDVSAPPDRPLYAAPAISPSGDRAYVV